MNSPKGVNAVNYAFSMWDYTRATRNAFFPTLFPISLSDISILRNLRSRVFEEKMYLLIINQTTIDTSPFLRTKVNRSSFQPRAQLP